MMDINEVFLHKGVWPTMVTPFTETGEIDYHAVAEIVEWYIQRGVAGIFAVCQSSEMFWLSLKERVELARKVVEFADGRVQVVGSGHISASIKDQITELQAMSETGVDAVVAITNLWARKDQGDDVWKENAKTVLRELPDIVLGLYECPYPYKRLLSPELLKWCAETGRFAFLKDTSCSVEQMHQKLDAIKGTSLSLFNANSATLLETLKLGAAGFSGVMANIHPELYAWLCANWREQPELAETLQNFLGVSSMTLKAYPIDAKYYLQMEGIPLTLVSRTKEAAAFQETARINMRQLRGMNREWHDRLNLLFQ